MRFALTKTCFAARRLEVLGHVHEKLAGLKGFEPSVIPAGQAGAIGRYATVPDRWREAESNDRWRRDMNPRWGPAPFPRLDGTPGETRTPSIFRFEAGRLIRFGDRGILVDGAGTDPATSGASRRRCYPLSYPSKSIHRYRMPAGVTDGLRSRVTRATTSRSTIELRPHLRTLGVGRRIGVP